MASNTATVAGVEVSTDHWIDGRRVSSSERFENLSPVDGSHLANVASGGKADNAQGSVLRPPAATSTSTSAASDSGSALEELARALAETPAAKLAPTRVL